MSQITQLSPDVISAYIDRKRPGRLDIVIDMNTRTYFPVPKKIEHADYVPTLPFNDSRQIIPVWMIMIADGAQYYLMELVTGASGFEDVHCVRHTPQQLSQGRDLAWALIVNSPAIKIERITRDEILYDYCDYTIGRLSRRQRKKSEQD